MAEKKTTAHKTGKAKATGKAPGHKAPAHKAPAHRARAHPPTRKKAPARPVREKAEARPVRETPARKEKPAPAVHGAAEGAVAIVDAENRKLSEHTLRPEVFAVAVNEHLLYEAVKQYRASARRGTHMTKNRALVSGSGRKPWRQKGTGRARVGAIRTPLWRHGGTVFGPQPRDYSYAMPRKARAAALRSALTRRYKDGGLRVVDRFGIDQPKTKVLKGLLDRLGVEGKTLLVDHQPDDALLLSGRNIPGLKVVDPSQVNVYDVLDCPNLLVSQEALGKLEEQLTP
ncbi:MAG: 50S ribosomal protein L4 [Acidobacteria bacterium]|nr:MAG: 50S ribosomal protein L4 [Acidobacteriota bacterium]